MPNTTPTPVSGTCRLSDDVLLSISKTDAKGKTTTSDYKVERLNPAPEVAIQAIRLTKIMGDGFPTENPDWIYECWLNEHGLHCTCLDYLARRENEQKKCKHIEAAVVCGLLPKAEEPS